MVSFKKISGRCLKVEAIVFDDDKEAFCELCNVLGVKIARDNIADMIEQAKLAQQQIQLEQTKQVNAKPEECLHLSELTKEEIKYITALMNPSCIFDASGTIPGRKTSGLSPVFC